VKFVNYIYVFIIFIYVTGCATTRMYTYSVDGEETICGKSNAGLGYIVVLPEAAWRKDQKEPVKREQMALEEINSTFKEISCGNISLRGGVREFSNWTALPKHEMLEKFSNEGIDTVIILRIEELTPRLEITFSVPFLWGGSSEADFRIRVISVKTGNVLADMRVKRELVDLLIFVLQSGQDMNLMLRYKVS